MAFSRRLSRGWSVLVFAVLSGISGGLALSASASSRILLSVPFFPDHTDQCGPSTLAALLSYWHKPVDLKKLRHEMYVEKMRGTFPMDLMLTARDHGLAAHMVHGDLDMIRAELEAGRPVLAMINTGFSMMPIDHYIVITGFDDDRRGLYAHTGGKPNCFFPYRPFMAQWEKTDRMAILMIQNREPV